MPTENRSSNTEQMVSVPRDEVERLVKLLQYQAHPYPSPHAEFWQGLLDAPAAQHQGEPVAWVHLRNGEPDYDREIVISNTPGDTNGDGDSWEPVYLHPTTSDGFSAGDMADQGAKAFAARDPEVEKLRAQLAERDVLLRRWASSFGHLGGCATPLRDETNAALSASAAPDAKP